jgi:hypothetical protein
MLKLNRLVVPLAAALCPAFSYTPAMENQAHRPDAAEAVPLLKAICETGAQIRETPRGAQMYCSPCPDFTSMHGLTMQQFQLRWVLPGSFTASGSQDIAAFFEGCEPLTANFGGAVLLNKTADGWKMARYDPAVSPVSARTIRLNTGRDLLFSESNAIGLGLDQNSLYTYDFTQQPVTAQHIILQIADTARACGYDITKASLDQVAWRGQDFTTTVTWGRIKATPDYLRDCPDKIPPVPTQTYRLNFTFDGATFQPAPDSVKTFDQINVK